MGKLEISFDSEAAIAADKRAAAEAESIEEKRIKDRAASKINTWTEKASASSAVDVIINNAFISLSEVSDKISSIIRRTLDEEEQDYAWDEDVARNFFTRFLVKNSDGIKQRPGFNDVKKIVSIILNKIQRNDSTDFSKNTNGKAFSQNVFSSIEKNLAHWLDDIYNNPIRFDFPKKTIPANDNKWDESKNSNRIRTTGRVSSKEDVTKELLWKLTNMQAFNKELSEHENMRENFQLCYQNLMSISWTIWVNSNHENISKIKTRITNSVGDESIRRRKYDDNINKCELVGDEKQKFTTKEMALCILEIRNNDKTLTKSLTEVMSAFLMRFETKIKKEILEKRENLESTSTSDRGNIVKNKLQAQIKILDKVFKWVTVLKKRIKDNRITKLQKLKNVIGDFSETAYIYKPDARKK